MLTDREYMKIEGRKKKKVNTVQKIVWESDETWGEKQQTNCPNAW